jgi:Fe-S cluster assembly scaffold protein SufB
LISASRHYRSGCRWRSPIGRPRFPAIDYQEIIYYAAPKQQEKKASLDEVDPKLLETFDKLGIPLRAEAAQQCGC